MAEQEQQPDANEVLFVNLVMMLASMAWQGLGKTMNPATGKADVELGAAEVAIDMLGMLEARTRGNLKDQEARFLTDTLSTLRMNYFETSQAQGAQPSTAQAPAKPADEAPPAKEAPAGEADAKDAARDEAREPKFRKSYGAL